MKKENINIVIIGHVDHGKSTLIGRLLIDTGSLPKEKIAEINRISKELGKETGLAFFTDQLKEEREKDITIDTTQIFFKTRKKDFCLVDTPGHVKFIKNMITGASLVKFAIVIVDAEKGVMEQTRRHIYLMNILGLHKLIVVINKMDLVDYNQRKFENIKKELLKFLEYINIKPSFVIPVSARIGVNISKHSSRTDWYNGPSLLKAMDSLKILPDNEKEPLRFPVQDIYYINEENIIVGKITSGTIKKNQSVILFPQNKELTVNSIRAFPKNKKKAQAGENIGLVFKEDVTIERGNVIYQKENPPEITSSLKGNIFWMSQKPLEIGKKFKLRCSTQLVDCFIEKIEKRIDSSKLKVLQEDAATLKTNEVGEIIIKTDKSIAIEKYPFIEELGRFVLEDVNDTKAIGLVTG